MIQPMREFVSLREAMDKLFEDSFIRPMVGHDGALTAFPIDLYETPDAYTLKASLPGLKPEDISIDVTVGTVAIKGEFKEELEIKEEAYLRKERKFGKFFRTLELPLSIDPAKVEATFKDGILKLVLPKAEIVKPKQIKVKVT